jgi:hypothetical protein
MEEKDNLQVKKKRNGIWCIMFLSLGGVWNSFLLAAYLKGVIEKLQSIGEA